MKSLLCAIYKCLKRSSDSIPIEIMHRRSSNFPPMNYAVKAMVALVLLLFVCTREEPW